MFRLLTLQEESSFRQGFLWRATLHGAQRLHLLLFCRGLRVRTSTTRSLPHHVPLSAPPVNFAKFPKASQQVFPLRCSALPRVTIRRGDLPVLCLQVVPWLMVGERQLQPPPLEPSSPQRCVGMSGKTL